jgi:hypothetical protein
VKWDGNHFYGIPYKLNNGLARLGHHVFSFCDRDIADSYLLGLRRAGQGHVNRKLLRVCEQVRPELVLLGLCTLIRPETIASMRAAFPGLRIAHWNCDPLFDAPNLKRLKLLAPLVDATFVTTAGDALKSIVELGGRAAFMPNPVDRSVESLRVFETPDLGTDLVFMGNPDRSRTAICDRVRSRLPELNFVIRGTAGMPGAYGADVFDLLARSKMGLSLSRRNDVFLYSSDRMSMMLGCGLLTFLDRKTGFDSLFGDDEIAFYEDLDDLVTKIRRFAADDGRRADVARRGWRKAHEIFCETLVAQWIIDATFGSPDKNSYAWPTTIHGAN